MTSSKLQRSSYPTCPWCGLTNYVYGQNREYEYGYWWNGEGAALRAGQYAHLWTRKGRIYGGPRSKRRRWNRDQPAPVRVNEKRWKILYFRPRRLIACANPFHEDRTK